MGIIIGLVVVLGMVFGGYALSGGSFHVILHALPLEGMMIGGASLGAFVVSNKKVIGMSTLKSFGTAFKGAYWKKQDYLDLLCLMFSITKLMKTKGMMVLEAHIEKPEESNLFTKYPKILHDHFAIDLICDTIRMMTMGMDNPYHHEDIIDKKLEQYHHEHAAPAHALQTVADGLPAIGIVAAVLGVIKTMSSITEPAEILGKMIGGALVGTFLGVFLGYCFIGPIASKLGQIYDGDQKFYLVIKEILIAHLRGNAPIVSVEIGRGNIAGYIQPSFAEMEEATNQVKIES